MRKYKCKKYNLNAVSLYIAPRNEAKTGFVKDGRLVTHLHPPLATAAIFTSQSFSSHLAVTTGCVILK